MRRNGRQAAPSVVWNGYREGGDLVAEDGHGGVFRASLAGAHGIRVGQYSAPEQQGG
jgi:hypothetical protein